jgi:purine-binding chemotaxis protein CheW
VPNAGSHIRGVINLRGKVIPVVDVADILHLPQQEASKETRIIVLEVNFGTVTEKIGVLVDEVHEVYEVTAEKIEEAPPMFRGENYNYILAVSKEVERTRLLLDITKLLLRPQEHMAVKKA